MLSASDLGSISLLSLICAVQALVLFRPLTNVEKHF